MQVWSSGHTQTSLLGYFFGSWRWYKCKSGSNLELYYRDRDSMTWKLAAGAQRACTKMPTCIGTERVRNPSIKFNSRWCNYSNHVQPHLSHVQPHLSPNGLRHSKKRVLVNKPHDWNYWTCCEERARIWWVCEFCTSHVVSWRLRYLATTLQRLKLLHKADSEMWTQFTDTDTTPSRNAIETHAQDFVVHSNSNLLVSHDVSNG